MNSVFDYSKREYVEKFNRMFFQALGVTKVIQNHFEVLGLKFGFNWAIMPLGLVMNYLFPYFTN